MTVAPTPHTRMPASSCRCPVSPFSITSLIGSFPQSFGEIFPDALRVLGRILPETTVPVLRDVRRRVVLLSENIVLEQRPPRCACCRWQGPQVQHGVQQAIKAGSGVGSL